MRNEDLRSYCRNENIDYLYLKANLPNESSFMKLRKKISIVMNRMFSESSLEKNVSGEIEVRG